MPTRYALRPVELQGVSRFWRMQLFPNADSTHRAFFFKYYSSGIHMGVLFGKKKTMIHYKESSGRVYIFFGLSVNRSVLAVLAPSGKYLPIVVPKKPVDFV